MTRTVFGKWLWDSRRAVLAWSMALLVTGCGYAAFWPTINDPELLKALANYPKALLEALNYTDFASPAGYLNATVYGLLVGILLLIYAVVTGTRLIAGDEEAGTLDLVLAQPVSRAAIALQRFAAYTVSLIVISTVLWLGMVAVRGPAQLVGISALDLAAMHVHVIGYGAFFGAVTFAVGAATGRRAVALAVGSGMGVFAYAASGLLPQVNGLEWVRSWSAFTWLNGSDPLRHGVDAAHLGIMVGVAALLVAVGTWGFSQRDVAA